MIVALGAADALVHVPRGNGELAAGSTVCWLRLGSLALTRCARRRAVGAARRRGARTSVRMSSRIGPRRGRSSGAGYGA